MKNWSVVTAQTPLHYDKYKAHVHLLEKNVNNTEVLNE